MKFMMTRLTGGVAIAAIATLFSVISTASIADANNKIKHQKSITLNVGQAAIVHGRRGECGKLPTQADLAKSKSDINAKLKTGRIAFGKPGVRRSGGCNGWTPAYETIFVAERPGRETVRIHGDDGRITVR